MAGRFSKWSAVAFSLFMAMCVALVYAGDKDFWSAKPYTEWTQKEVARMLKNSPWAKEIALSVAIAGGGGGEGGGDAEGGGGGGRRRGGSESNMPSGASGGALPSIVVRWYARPIREALAQNELTSPNPRKEAIDTLMKFNSPFYSILVDGWSASGSGGRGARGEAVQKLREETYLQKKNKQKLTPADVLLPTRRGEALVLRFPKEQDGRPTLTLDDKEAELVVKVRDNTYHIKFKLADMLIKGQLEL